MIFIDIYFDTKPELDDSGLMKTFWSIVKAGAWLVWYSIGMAAFGVILHTLSH